jgi:hypothetical protein
MGRFLRWGNWAVAKLIEALFNTPTLTDVGCTMRVVSGPAVRSLEPHFTADHGAFGAEMMLLSIIGGWRIVQLPVNYRARVGRAGETSSFANAFGIGVEMIKLVLAYRLRRDRVRRRLRVPDVSDIPRGEPRPGGEPVHFFPWLRLPRVRATDSHASRDRSTRTRRS